jgi:D-alanine-D-alanine ligase
MRLAFTHNVQTQRNEAEAEWDTPATIDAITRALESLGHHVVPIAVNGPIHTWLPRLQAARPQLIFNTAEGSGGRFREASYPSLFEMLGIPYTGCDAYVCGVTLDKRLTKMLAERLNVRTPRWAFMHHKDDPVPAELGFPLILKPNFEGSSKGITSKSIVDSPARLREMAAELLARYPEGLLVEEFIEGRDVVVPWLEAASPATGGVLAPAGYRFMGSNNQHDPRAIYDFALKNVDNSRVEVESPLKVPDATLQELADATRAVVRDLGVRDITRLDFRLDRQGRAYFLEINALPGLEPGATIFESAKLVGLPTFATVLGKVIESAARRWKLDDKPAQRATRLGLIFNVKRIKPADDGSQDQEAEYDSQSTVDHLAETLRSLGHDVVPIEANADLPAALQSSGIEVAFNVSEGIRGRGREALVPSLLDHLGIPYTGGDPATMALALDKQLAKHVVHDAGVPTAASFLLHRGDEPVPAGLAFPMVVKPVAEGSSKGVHAGGVVHDEAQLRKTARAVIERYQQAALAEEYLPGREFTVGVLSSPAFTILPPMEIGYTDKAGKFPIYSFKHKQAFTPEIDYDVKGSKISPELRAEIDQVVTRAWKALGCRDVSRFDLRMDRHGRVNFIECNPLPGLTPDWSDLCLISNGAGITYAQLIERVLAPALERLTALRNGAASLGTV